MWSSTCNNDHAIHPFATIVEKDLATKGSFAADFNSVCSTYSITRCPHIKALTQSNGEEKLFIQNAELDLANWRASLLSSATVGSKVREINVHGCTLTPQHLVELAAALAKSGVVKAVSLQYLVLSAAEENTAHWIDAFKALLAESTQVEFLSLRGCRLGNAIVEGIASALASNWRLKSLSLAENGLTEHSVQHLQQSLRFLHTFQALSLASNQISDAACITPFLELVSGVAVAASDEATIKALTKSLGDKNKAVKEANKKRKKAGVPEFEELPALPEYIKQVDGSKVFANSSLKFVDIGNNPLNEAALLDIMSRVHVGQVEESGLKIGCSGLFSNSAGKNAEDNDQLQAYQGILLLS